MHPHPHDADDLSDLERRLAGWAPADDGLDADAVLFAAGRASVRPGPGRFVWPALTGLLTALSIVLGLCLASEHGERLALARQLRQQTAPTPKPSPPIDDIPVESPRPEEPSPDSYLAGRRALEKGLDAWPMRAVARAGSSPTPDSVILRLGQRDALIDP